MKAREFDRRFDGNENIAKQLDVKKARRPGFEQRRVNVDFPAWVIEELDLQSARLGVTRQSVIKMWIVERLEQISS